MDINSTNRINSNTPATPSTIVEKSPTGVKKNFWSSTSGIVTIIVIAFVILSAVAIISYNLALGTKSSKESNNNPTPTPTATSTNTPTPSTTTTLPPVITTVAPTNAPTKFTVTTALPTQANNYQLTATIKLGAETVKSFGLYQNCDIQSGMNVPEPVVSNDGTKVYYVDPTNPSQVKEIDNKKVEKVFFTPTAPYKYVAGIAINTKNQFGYTVIQNIPYSCKTSQYTEPKAAFVINSKVFPQTTTPLNSTYTFQTIEAMGDTYFITRDEFNGLGVGGGAASTTLRKITDGSSVKSFGGSGITYKGSNYVIITDGYFDAPPTGEANHPTQSVFKVDLNTAAITYIVSDTLIREFKVVGTKLVVTYGGYFDDNYEIKGESKTVEFQL